MKGISRRDFLAAATAYAQVPSAMASRASRLEVLTGDAGFLKLRPAHQEQVRHAWLRNPGNLRLQENLLALVRSTNFRLLDDPSKSELIVAFGNRFARDTGARSVLLQLAGTSALQQMKEKPRQKLIQLVAGANPFLSGPARNVLDLWLHDPQFVNAPKERVKILNSFIERQPSRELTLTVPPAWVQRTPAAPFSIEKVGAPLRIQYRDSDGKDVAGPAQKYLVRYRDQQLPALVALESGVSDRFILDLAVVARAIGRLDPRDRADFSAIQYRFRPRPDDPQLDPKSPIHQDPQGQISFQADDDGVLVVFPFRTAWRGRPNLQAVMDQDVAHEHGHIVSQRLWKTDADWKPWEEAIASDVIRPSQYGKNDRRDDFAETWSLYRYVRGSQYEAEIRAMMPARFAILDRLIRERPKVAAG